MFYGYGSEPTFILPATPEEAAQQLCAAMQGTWRPDGKECQVGDQTYTLPDFLPGSMPSGPCPSAEVMTPAGCKPYPGGVDPVDPPVPPVPPNGQPPATAGTSTPAWVLPAAIGGIAAIAVIALVATK